MKKDETFIDMTGKTDEEKIELFSRIVKMSINIAVDKLLSNDEMMESMLEHGPFKFTLILDNAGASIGSTNLSVDKSIESLIRTLIKIRTRGAAHTDQYDLSELLEQAISTEH